MKVRFAHRKNNTIVLVCQDKDIKPEMENPVSLESSYAVIPLFIRKLRM